MTADLDTNVNGSIGWKAAAFDYNVDASNADGYQALLNAAVSDKSAVQQQLADERDPSVTNSLAQQLANERDPKVANSLAQKLESAEAKAKTNAALPTDVVKKADVKSRVDAVQTELGKVKMGLTGVQNVNETRAALNKVADLVK